MTMPFISHTSRLIATGLLIASLFSHFANSAKANIEAGNNGNDIRVELANRALKESLDLPPPSARLIEDLLLSKNYSELEPFLDNILSKYLNDYRYESQLIKTYALFSSENIDLGSLNRWVQNRHSYNAYAARGMFFVSRGFDVRGTRFSNKTAASQFEKMGALFSRGEPDLFKAIKLKPEFIPAYIRLAAVARATTTSYNASEIMRKALSIDNRSYYVRNEYLTYLQPRWGGSYAEMQKFIDESAKYSNLNPRNWSFLGAVHADRASRAKREENFTLAIELYTLALSSGDRSSWLKSRGICHYKTGNFAQAINDFQRALYYQPSDKSARRWLNRVNRKR